MQFYNCKQIFLSVITDTSSKKIRWSVPQKVLLDATEHTRLLRNVELWCTGCFLQGNEMATTLDCTPPYFRLLNQSVQRMSSAHSNACRDSGGHTVTHNSVWRPLTAFSNTAGCARAHCLINGMQGWMYKDHNDGKLGLALGLNLDLARYCPWTV